MYASVRVIHLVITDQPNTESHVVITSALARLSSEFWDFPLSAVD